jgi:hypothetical protein
MPSPDAGATALARQAGQEEALLVASGTAAIELALEVLQVGPGDEVIVPDVGCHCVGAAAARSGATVVFASVDESLVLSADDVRAALTRSTRAVVAVHQYGLPCDISAIRRVVPGAVTIVEDFAQAWGLRISGAAAGSLGDLSVTSFGPTKPLSIGAGGALLGPSWHLHDAGGANERNRARPPSGARFPKPLLPLLPAAMLAADQRVSARRRAASAILKHAAGQGVDAVATAAGSLPSWTRLPLYLPLGADPANVVGPPHLVERTQPMHPVPPSALPMFTNVPTRLAHRTARTREPLLVKPSSDPSRT